MEILYRDRHYVAVNKAAGLLVHRTRIDSRERRYAMQLLRDRLGVRVYPVHRLDKPTAGVLLFALSPSAAASMTRQFAAQRVQKRYLAVVRGRVVGTMLIDHALREQRDLMTDALADADKPAQVARTELCSLATVELPIAAGRYASSRYSLLELRPLTGRKHQLRRHLKHISHPIVGDTTHGDGRHNRVFREHFDCNRLLLACTGMKFVHPYTGAVLDIRAPLDAEFTRVCAALGWADAAAEPMRADVQERASV